VPDGSYLPERLQRCAQVDMAQLVDISDDTWTVSAIGQLVNMSRWPSVTH